MLKKIHSLVIYLVAVIVVNYSFLPVYLKEIESGYDIGYVIALLISILAVIFAYIVAEFNYKSFFFLISCIMVGICTNFYLGSISSLSLIMTLSLALLYCRYVIVSQNSSGDYFLSNWFTFIGYSMILFMIFVRAVSPIIGFIFILFMLRNTLKTDKRISLSNGDVKSSIRLETIVFLYIFILTSLISIII